MNNMYPRRALFKTAEDNTGNKLPHAIEWGAEGAATGATMGAVLGTFSHLVNKNKKPEMFSFVGKSPKGKMGALAASGLDAGLRVGLGGVQGAALGFSTGAGVGALGDYADIKKREQEQMNQITKDYLRERMEGMRMEQEASSVDLVAGLIKTAGFINNVRKAFGGDYRKATNAYNELDNMESFSSMPPTEYFPKLEAAHQNMFLEQRLRDQAQQDLVPPALGTAAAGGLIGLGIAENKRMEDRLLAELAAERAAEGPTGIDGHNRQGAGSVSNAPAGEDKTASHSSLFNPLEKTAGPLNFIKNFTGSNLRKAQNRVNEIKNVPTDQAQRSAYEADAMKAAKNAKADRNRAWLGGGTALVGGGALYGAYKGKQNSTETGVNEPMNPQTEQKLAFDSLINRLEKTAAPNFRELGSNIAERAGNLGATIKGGVSNASNATQDALVQAQLGGSLAAAQMGQNVSNAAGAAGDALSNYGYKASGQDLATTLSAHREGLVNDQARNTAIKDFAIHGGGTALGAGALGAGGYALANAGGDDDEEQVASNNLMYRLEKTAEESVNPGRQDRRLLTETFVGAGPLGYWAKKNNTLGVQPEDSHAMANAKLGAIGGGIAGAGMGAAQAALVPAIIGAKAHPAAVAGAGLAGALGGGVYGGLAGGGLGYLHDRYDQNEASRGDDDEEQVAYEDLMSRLEKTAAPNIVGKAKNLFANAKTKGQLAVGNVTGSNARRAEQNVQKFWENPNNHTLTQSEFQNRYNKLNSAAEKATAKTDSARKTLKNVGAGAAGGLAAGAAGTAALTKNKDDDNEKAANEVLNGLYKEAASAIIDETLPPVRQHVDPMSRITFSR